MPRFHPSVDVKGDVINYKSPSTQNRTEEFMKSTLKQLVESIASQKAPGPATAFTVAHLFFALEMMAEKPIGRNSLAKKLEIGEGTVRTIVNRLKSCDLIVTSKEGCSLTTKGLAVWKQFEKRFPKRGEVGKTELTNFECNYAFLVKNSGHNVKSGIEQRDAAVVAGAKGAVIIVSKKGHLMIESVSDRLEQKFPAAADKILQTFHPEDNDVIVLVGASTSVKAKEGAFAASWALIEQDET